MNINYKLQLTILDNEEKDLYSITYPFRSFTQNFIRLYRCLLNSATETIVSTTGATSSLISAIAILRLDAAIAADTYGITVGTGSTAVSVYDTKLGGTCICGTSTNQLRYQAVTFDTVSSSSTVSSFNIRRIVSNYSPADITINEVSMIAYGGGSATTRFLFARDVVSGGRVLPVNKSMEIKYTISVAI